MLLRIKSKLIQIRQSTDKLKSNQNLQNKLVFDIVSQLGIDFVNRFRVKTYFVLPSFNILDGNFQRALK